MKNVGAQAYKFALPAFTKYVNSDKSVKILDVAAGTGRVGEYLHQLGYSNIDGTDISSKMLEKAKEKNVYQRLIHGG